MNAPHQILLPETNRVDIHMVEISAARRFARKAHGDQLYDNFPYLFHLDKVAEILRPYSGKARVLGYLHDVLKDTSASEKDIRKNFGAHMAHCCRLISDPEGENRAERKAKLHATLATVTAEDAIVLIVKAADRLSNVRHCLMGENRKLMAMYQAEHPEFREVVFRPGLCDHIWVQLDFAIRQQL